MKWRVLVLLLAGLSMIYLVSLLQDTPYPHPVIIQASVPKKSRVNEPTQVLLDIHDDYIYRTHVHYEAVLDTSRGYVRGTESIKAGVIGLVVQSRRKVKDLTSDSPEEDWQLCFRHLFDGPITQVSQGQDHRFAVLYHTLTDQDIKHLARIYYYNNDTIHYQDVQFPGNTMIRAISLEEDSILYVRDPDRYRFRIAKLEELKDSSDHPISLTEGTTGDLVKPYHQPVGTEAHVGLLCRLYSSNEDTYRVLTLDIHKTKYMFHSNVSIVDYSSLHNQWKFRDHLNSKDKIIVDEELVHMAFVDGAHFHHERTVIEMPKPTQSRSKDGKTLVISLIRNNFQTLDFTDKLDTLKSNAYDRKHLYRDNDEVINEFYHSMQSVDSVEPNDGYDPTDIRGVQLNSDATSLAVWTQSNSIYIYKRGEDGTKPHHLEKPLEWILRMVIAPKEGQLGSITPIGACLFWSFNNTNYLSVGMKNNIVNTYLIDETEEQKVVNLRTFIRDKWDLLIVMSMVVIVFVVNEYKSYP